MMHKAWSSIEEVPYCFSRSSVKFQGHTALKIVKFDPNWAFPDCNSSLNSPMAMKCCTKLETANERCPIVFQGHPSNFKVTRDKTSPILTQIGRFRTLGRSQLSNPSDLPCYYFISWFSCIEHCLVITRHNAKYLNHLLLILCQSTILYIYFKLRPSSSTNGIFGLSVCPSVCPSVRLSIWLSGCHTFLTMFPSSYHHEIFSYYQWPK